MKRNVIGNKVVDPSAISNNEYNDASGAQKQVDVGPKLTGIPTGAGPTTNATTVRALPQIGRSVAVYNNAGAVGAITFGKDATVTAQAPGAIDANGNPGIPCPPNAWTHLSAGDCQFVIASAATLLVFVIEDDTSLVKQTTR